LHGILTFRTAAFNVIRQANCSKAALTAVALGVTAMMLAAGFIDWNLCSGARTPFTPSRAYPGHEAPFSRVGALGPALLCIPNREQDTKKLLEGPGVVAVAPRLLIAGLASSGETTLSFIGEGVDPALEAELSSALRFPEGRNLQPGENNTVVVGRGLADNLGLRLGGTLVLVANTKGGRINAVEAKTVGFSSPSPRPTTILRYGFPSAWPASSCVSMAST
jgi:putative ABC transport system permease protein